MHFPASVLSALGLNCQSQRPVVFVRAVRGHPRIQRAIPGTPIAQRLCEYLRDPAKASPLARRTYRQAIVLRSVDGKLRHYPLWALFSNQAEQDKLALKYNQVAPKVKWVRYKRMMVCDYLNVRANHKALEVIDSCAAKSVEL